MYVCKLRHNSATKQFNHTWYTEGWREEVVHGIQENSKNHPSPPLNAECWY